MSVYEFRLFAIRWVLLGFTGYVIEVLFTGGHTLVHTLNTRGLEYVVSHLGLSTKSDTGILAFFIYCWASVPFTFLTPALQRWTVWAGRAGIYLRSLVYGLVFMAIELLTGVIAVFVLGASYADTWDYRDMPLNVLGLITFAYYPAWVIAGVIGEWWHTHLLAIDDILAGRAVKNTPQTLARRVRAEGARHGRN